MPPFAPSWPATSSRPGDRRHCLQVFKSWPVVSGPGGTLQASSHLPVPICSLCFGGFQRRRLSGSCGFRPRGQKGKAGLSGCWLQPGKRPGRLCPRLLQTLPAAFPEPSLPNSAPSDPSGLGLHRGLMPFGTRASAEALQSCRWEQMVAANDSQRAEGPLLERIAG